MMRPDRNAVGKPTGSRTVVRTTGVPSWRWILTAGFLWSAPPFITHPLGDGRGGRGSHCGLSQTSFARPESSASPFSSCSAVHA